MVPRGELERPNRLEPDDPSSVSDVEEGLNRPSAPRPYVESSLLLGIAAPPAAFPAAPVYASPPSQGVGMGRAITAEERRERTKRVMVLQCMVVKSGWEEVGKRCRDDEWVRRSIKERLIKGEDAEICKTEEGEKG